MWTINRVGEALCEWVILTFTGGFLAFYLWFKIGSLPPGGFWH